ncbi:MAG: PorT family protein [Prevotella sp.]|jgi:opacity protein-like surface antigen|nr:PorT family protein [Prevotella sp.]
MKALLKVGLLSVLFLFVTMASAQNKIVTVGVRAGVNFSGVSNGAPGDKTKVGFNFGMTADFRLSDEMYLLTGLEYTVKGTKGNDYIESEKVHFITKEKPAYLQLPLHVGYLWAINRDFRLMFHAGLYAAYGVGGKVNRKWVYEDRTETGKIDYFGVGVSKFDWGLGGGINVEYDRYVLGLGYDHGLRNISPEYGNGHIRNFYITLGYLF